MAKRRANGEGSIRRRRNGRWEVQIMDGYKPDGRRNMRSFSGKTQKEAKEKRDEYLRKRAAGLLTGREIRFDEWADIWFRNHTDNVKPTTQEGYSYTLRVLKAHFGRRTLAQIKTMDIEQFLKKLRREGKSDSYLAQCRGMLYQIFNKAVANDLLIKNPVAYADKMRKGPPKRKESFTPEEVQLLMENLSEDKIGWSIRLMLATGMRTQELLVLEPRHIAEDGSTITIEQAVVMEKGTAKIGTPKSFDSYRCIPVPENVRYCAKLLRETDKKFIWEMRKLNMPCNPSTFRKKFDEAVRSVEGVRPLTPHSCRHTYVSQMQALGVDLATIQSIVGHADVDMTVHYLHVQEPIRQEAIGKFSAAFSNRRNTSHPDTLDALEPA